MQIINVYNDNMETAATNLKNALAQYGSTYFDSYDTDFSDANGVKRIQCKVGQNVAVEFQYKSENYYMKLVSGGKTIAIGTSSYYYMVSALYVYDNAILFVFRRQYESANSYEAPMLLYKKKNGDTAFVLFTNSNITGIYRGNDATRYCTAINVSRSTGAVDFSVLPMVFSSNSNGNVNGFSLFSLNDGVIIKDAFIVMNSDFRSHYEPISYVIDGVTYTGFGGNYLAVKGT